MMRSQAEMMIQKHGSMTKAAEAARVSRHVIARALKKCEATPLLEKKKTLNDFRQTYDKGFYIPQKIKLALAKLGASWEYEVGFAKLAGVSLMDLGLVRDQFADHVISLGRDNRRAWCGSKSMAAQMRAMI